MTEEAGAFEIVPAIQPRGDDIVAVPPATQSGGRGRATFSRADTRGSAVTKRCRGLLLATATVGLAACCGGPVTDAEEAAFIRAVRAEVEGAQHYNDALLAVMVEKVCRVLEMDRTTAHDALDVVDNYRNLAADEQAMLLELGAREGCVEQLDKIATA